MTAPFRTRYTSGKRERTEEEKILRNRIQDGLMRGESGSGLEGNPAAGLLSRSPSLRIESVLFSSSFFSSSFSCTYFFALSFFFSSSCVSRSYQSPLLCLRELAPLSLSSLRSSLDPAFPASQSVLVLFHSSCSSPSLIWSLVPTDSFLLILHFLATESRVDGPHACTRGTRGTDCPAVRSGDSSVRTSR